MNRLVLIPFSILLILFFGFECFSQTDSEAPKVSFITPSPLGQQFVAGVAVAFTWKSTDNSKVKEQEILFSFNDGKMISFGMLSGNADSFVIALDETLKKGLVKIVATDDSGNKGEATTSFSVQPSITGLTFSKPVLLIVGDGFSLRSDAPADFANMKIIINNKEIKLIGKKGTLRGVLNTVIALKVRKLKDLNIINGMNELVVVIGGIQSNVYKFFIN